MLGQGFGRRRAGPASCCSRVQFSQSVLLMYLGWLAWMQALTAMLWAGAPGAEEVSPARQESLWRTVCHMYLEGDRPGLSRLAAAGL